MLTINPAVVPINDNICGAIPLTVNPDWSSGIHTEETSIGATTSPVDATACRRGVDGDVWYSFVATATNHRIDLTVNQFLDMGISLWTGPDCNTISFVPNTCTQGYVCFAPGLTIGQTYYIRVCTYQSGYPVFNIAVGRIQISSATLVNSNIVIIFLK